MRNWRRVALATFVLLGIAGCSHNARPNPSGGKRVVGGGYVAMILGAKHGCGIDGLGHPYVVVEVYGQALDPVRVAASITVGSEAVPHALSRQVSIDEASDIRLTLNSVTVNGSTSIHCSIGSPRPSSAPQGE
jgi:hypothetical protein